MAKGSVDRRDFLKGAAVTAQPRSSRARAPLPPSRRRRRGPAPAARADRGRAKPTRPSTSRPSPPIGQAATSWSTCSSRSNFEYVASNPGSSFRGIHESIINYGNNTKPEFITCCHEESSVAMAHGYFKVEGKPMAVLCHGTVGLQHAAMAIYNAYCDRVPVYILAGNTLDATMRRPGVEWAHSVQDAAAMVRDFVKWDDMPVSLPHFAESAVRAYKIAMTPPMMPVLVVIDGELQEDPIPAEDRRAPAHPQADDGDAAAGRFGRRRRSRAAARQRAESGDRRRPRRAHAGRHRAASSSSPRRCRRRSSISAAA